MFLSGFIIAVIGAAIAACNVDAGIHRLRLYATGVLLLIVGVALVVLGLIVGPFTDAMMKFLFP